MNLKNWEGIYTRFQTNYSGHWPFDSMWQIYAKHHLNDYCRNKVGQWLFFKDSSQAFGKKNIMIQEMLIKQINAIGFGWKYGWACASFFAMNGIAYMRKKWVTYANFTGLFQAIKACDMWFRPKYSLVLAGAWCVCTKFLYFEILDKSRSVRIPIKLTAILYIQPFQHE